LRSPSSLSGGREWPKRSDLSSVALLQAPGVVFALDPQMWVPEEKLYIRVEDTVVVTEKGNENLTGLAPLELDVVEKLMREEGLLEHIPPFSMEGSS